MRSITLITFLILLIQFSKAQTADAFEPLMESKVPVEVRETFANQHPTAKVEEWREFRGRFEAKYQADGEQMFSRYNDEGLFIEDRILMDWNKAPEKLKEGKEKTNKKYWEVVEFYKRIADNKEHSYILQLESDKGEVSTLYFDKSGELEVKSKSGY
ncbi:MAG: hypothetical protein RIC95_04850 [Vicingaceae bacterium]